MDILSSFSPDGNTPQKQCTGPCGRTLPATPEYFHRQKGKKDGLYGLCKECRKKRIIELAESQPKVLVTEKTCIGTCGRTLPATTEFFLRDKYRKDGLFPHCKECKKEYDKSHYSRPQIRKKKLAQMSTRYSDPERHKHLLESAAAYRNRPDIQEKIRAYRHSPEGLTLYRTHAQNRRAQKKAIAGTYTIEQIEAQLKRQKHRCYYVACGHAMFEKRNGKYVYHIDHTFPISRVTGTDIPANSIDYLVLTCPSCNLQKHDKFPWEWPEGGRLL